MPLFNFLSIAGGALGHPCILERTGVTWMTEISKSSIFAAVQCQARSFQNGTMHWDEREIVFELLLLQPAVMLI